MAPAIPTTAAERYESVRATTEELAAPLSAEDQTAQSMPDVSPTKWHRAHTTWFFEEFVLGPFDAEYSPRHPSYRYLFNSYYEAVGARHARPDRGVITRPGVAEIASYRTQVDDAMARLLNDNRLQAVQCERVDEVIELGLHHEQQHQELLLMDIKHVLSRNITDPMYRSLRHSPGTPTPLGWNTFAAGLVEIGHGGHGFGFDNEFPRHQTWLAPYELSSRPVSCGDVIGFIDDCGYARPELWLSDGWALAQTQAWEAPLYWSRDADEWSVFTLGGRRSVDPAEPVCHVSYYEADAIARWLGARLPTEAEWEHAAANCLVEGNLLDRDVLQPVAPGVSPNAPTALFGDVWEWTASAYLPYHGFQPAPGAVGEYNGKFMVNQHVLKGGSALTPGDHVRASYRNFFPPAARWPMTGLRLARDIAR